MSPILNLPERNDKIYKYGKIMKLGIVAPCYNEHEILAESAGRLTVLMDDLVAKKKIDADSSFFLSMTEAGITHGRSFLICSK